MSPEPESQSEDPSPSLEGWDPANDGPVDVPDVVEKAFAYRGNVSIDTTGGRALVGYLFNRNTSGSRAFVQYLDDKGDGPFTLPYASIANIRFTGNDPAKGNSYVDYQRRKAQNLSALDAPAEASHE